MDASLPSHPDVPTYRYPPAGLHPGTSAHMHGEAPIRPSMDMGPRIKGSVPSPHYRHTDKYTRKDGHMCGHIGKRGRSHRGKRGNRHMGARTVLWIGVCMWSHVCTRGSTPSPVPLEKETLPPCIVGWVGGKNGGPVCEKGGGLEKPPPDGGKWGWTVEGGEKSPWPAWASPREGEALRSPYGRVREGGWDSARPTLSRRPTVP